MRTHVARGVLVVFSAVALSGCYSNGGWNMPWKSSAVPVQPESSPDGVGTPAKPSGIARRQPTAPSSGYPSSASGTTAPVVPTGVPANYNAPGTGYPAPASQYSYPPSVTAAAPGYGGTPLYGEQVRCPAMARRRPARPQTDMGPAAPRPPRLTAARIRIPVPLTAPSYSTSPPRRPMLAVFLQFSRQRRGGYAPANATSGGYTNPVRSSQGTSQGYSYPDTTAAPAATAAARTDTALRPAVPAHPRRRRRIPLRRPSHATHPLCRGPLVRADRAIALRPEQRYSQPPATSYGSPATGTSGSGYSAPASNSGYSQPPATSYGSPATGTGGSGYCTRPATTYSQPPATSYGSPATSTGVSGYGPAGSQRLFAAAGHQLWQPRHRHRGIELWAAAGANSYSQPPATSYGSPATGTGARAIRLRPARRTAGSSSDPPAYRPGSTSDYVPQRPGAPRRPQSLPRRQAAQASPRPAIYRRPRPVKVDQATVS